MSKTNLTTEEEDELLGTEREQAFAEVSIAVAEAWDEALRLQEEGALFREELEQAFREDCSAMAEAMDEAVSGKDLNAHEPVVEIVKKR